MRKSSIQLILFILLCCFTTACVSAPTTRKKSSSKAYQHQRARAAFDELDGKPTTYTKAAEVPKVKAETPAKPAASYTPQVEVKPVTRDIPEKNLNSPAYLTAKGFGQSEPEAIRQAKAELSNIFESRIMSDVTSKTQQLSGSFKTSTYKKSIQSDIRVISNIQLEGVIIGKTTKENGEYVVIAALNKSMASRKWLNDIKKIDTKIDVLYENSNSASGKYLKLKPLKKIMHLWVKREVAVSRLRVLGYSTSNLRQHDLASLLKQISAIKSAMLIDIDISGNYGQTVRDLISKILTEKGFKIGDFESQSDVLISGSLKIKKVRNNNKNFKFSRAIASLKIIDSQTGKQVGQVSEDARGAHLNYEEAAHRAVKKVSKIISSKLMDLF